MKPRAAPTAHSSRPRLVLAGLLGVGWLAGCSDDLGGPCRNNCPQDPIVLSDPVPATAVLSGAQAAGARSWTLGDSVVYVSLVPGTAPTGLKVTVRSLASGDSLTTGMWDGGFDPIPVFAQAGDAVEVIVRDAAGAIVFQRTATVAAARPPIVVRTEPPPRKRDVPLNAAIIVVFTEPVTGGSVSSSSVQLLRGSTTVPGSVSLLQGTGAAAAFIPDAPLTPSTDYRLVVTRAVSDREGDALQSGVTVDFTTGQSSTGSAASLVISPSDSFHLALGATFQLTATVRDAAGNQLLDPVTWTTTNPQGLSVSATGLLTAHGYGVYDVTATTDGLATEVRVIVPSPSPGPPARVDITPASATVGAGGDTINLIATISDSQGRPVGGGEALMWISSDLLLATVRVDSIGGGGDAFATVTGVRPGNVTITASHGARSDSASVTVTPRPPAASVTITPAAATLLPQGTVQLSAAVRDANGKVLGGGTVTWTTDNAAVANVDAAGLVTALSQGTAPVTATSEAVSDTATITVRAFTFTSVTTGQRQSCGVTTANEAYCWGGNFDGELGDGSTTTSAIPTAVSGGLTFDSLSANGRHTCGLRPSGAVYCWGDNGGGELGDGTRGNIRTSPVAVQGGFNFIQVSAGFQYTCGVTTAGAAHCWGLNTFGQLGDGTTTGRSTPVPVLGGVTFAALSAGGIHTCGTTSAGAAHCWGANSEGRLGDGTTTDGPTPVAVLGGLTFVAVSAGYVHTCGVTTTGAAYCWGLNNVGQLGDGSTTSRSAPVAVLGGLTFASVSTGGFHTCGVTTAGAAYCWGANGFGRIGDGTMTDRSTPAAVQGGLRFAAVSAGMFHSCGVTTAGAAYCWGNNADGQLGNGTTTDSAVPVKVAGQP